METTREDLQKALSEIGPRGRGKPYPKGLLEQLVGYTVAKRREGLSIEAIGEDLGMSWRTLARWLGARTTARGFRRVEVVEARRASLVVHGPSGLRIEGLDIEGIAELVRRLGG